MGKKIAIVGAGPAGLAAARKLLPAGFSVDIYEKEAIGGGVMAFGIPEFRITKANVERQVDQVKALGANFKFNQNLKESDFIRLSKEYDYVFLAFGLTKVRKLGIPGEELPEALDALDFLRDFNFAHKMEMYQDRLPKLHGTAVVVGAGNVAMDGARVALRCGAKKVYIAYRRSIDEVPCTKAELNETIEEGVECKFLTNPVEILGTDHVTGVKCEIMELGEPDASGRRSPVGTGKYTTIDCDYVIAAIGQIPDKAIYDSNVIKNDKGYLVAVDGAYQTSIPNVYTGGDILLGAKTIGAAVKCGNDFAKIVLEANN